MVTIEKSLWRAGDRPAATKAQRGTTMIEVLVTLIILAIGLLGLAGLQARLQVSEMEAYQRAQALILLQDMASRLAVNRSNVAAYVTGAGNPVGSGATCADFAGDLVQWCEDLQGASETSAAGNVGAMVGGRGCVEDLDGGEYQITVAWQGLTPISAPPESVACGQDKYNGGNCSGDACRRTVTTIVRIADLAS